MGLQDILITPFYLIVFYLLAFVLRNKVSNSSTRKYFISGLTIKFVGAIGLGLIYQFYYGGGDTLNYWRNGEYIYKLLLTNPSEAFNLILNDPDSNQILRYSSTIWLMRSESAFFIVKLSGMIDLLTFRTYSATSLFFSLFSFSGSWAFFQLLVKRYPASVKKAFIAIFLMPSVVIWSAGILKDSITLGALFWTLWSVMRWVEFNKKSVVSFFILIMSMYLIFQVKFYVLMCLVPSLIVYVFINYFSRIKSAILKVMAAPTIAVMVGFFVFLSLDRLGQENKRYSIENIAQRSKITAYDLRYGWGGGSGSGYSLGTLDGSWSGMLRLAPQGIIAALFRPFIWEASNVLMLIAALESSVILFLSVKVLFKRNKLHLIKNPFLIFCLLFSLVFAFAVGVSTFNFGTLSRYRIPLLPFLMIFISFSSSKTQTKTYHPISE